MCMDKAAIQRILNDYDDFVITGHINPDGDAIGACYAMGMGLISLGKSVKVILDPYHEKFLLIPGGELRYTGQTNRCRVFLYLDCASPDRAGGEAKEFAAQAEITVSIDHHASNTGFADYNYVIPGASSTCELIYDIINDIIQIDAAIGAAIYAGLIYDTGGFRNGSTTSKTMDTAARLMALGIPFSEIYNGLCIRHTFLESKILSKAINNMALTADGKIAYSWISRAEMAALGVTPQDMEGIAEYIMDTEGAELAAFLYEKGIDEVKCSFRSITVDVSKLAQGYGGGGHVNAAGCTINGKLTEITDNVVEELRKSILMELRG